MEDEYRDEDDDESENDNGVDGSKCSWKDHTSRLHATTGASRCASRRLRNINSMTMAIIVEEEIEGVVIVLLPSKTRTMTKIMLEQLTHYGSSAGSSHTRAT